MNVQIIVDDHPIEAEEGTPLLPVCLANGIYIPNLCFLEDMAEPPVSCRLCFVEVEGETRPVTACTVALQQGMVVRTDTPAVRRLQKAGLQLLLSTHAIDCRNCPSNRRCDLQNMARFLSVPLKAKRFARVLKPLKCNQSDVCFDFYPNRCILCAKCMHVCRQRHGQTRMSFAARGFETTISFSGSADQARWSCAECNACVEICPVSAILRRRSE